eukprot:Mycagemm_TRINITY_DN10268_c0_g1::TRINITY_DN10268_c0_g1_i2::g.3953::m.3953 type:complete len:132 gc:universal TRINITY_DN10268_c0_g1_i2:1303-1698(+)
MDSLPSSSWIALVVVLPLAASLRLLRLSAERRPLCFATNTVTMEMRSSASSCSGLGSWCSPLLHSWWPRTTSFASACRKIHSRSSTPNLASLSWWETTTSPTPPLWTCSSRATSPGLFQLRPDATSWSTLV